MRPKFYKGQQIVVGNTNGDMIGTIISGRVVGEQWKYGVEFGSKSDNGNSPNYVDESEVKFALVDGNWTPVTKQPTVR